LRRPFLFPLFAAVLSLFMACSSADERAHELYSIAELEEQQRNLEHATQLYQEIIEKYPHTPFADQAKARLQELGKP
jgi:TolA-binding protein